MYCISRILIVWPSLKTSITRDRGHFSLIQTVNLIISHSTVKFDLRGGKNQLQSVAKSAEDIELKNVSVQTTRPYFRCSFQTCLRADVSYFLCCTRKRDFSACNKGNRRRLHAGNFQTKCCELVLFLNVFSSFPI